MKKIYKLLIFLILPILSVCCFSVPTYCSSTNISNDYFNISTDFDTTRNYYNNQNIQYVSLKNFNVSFNRPQGELIYSCHITGFNGGSNIHLSYIDFVYINAGGQRFAIGEIYLIYTYLYDGLTFSLYSDFQFTPYNISVPLFPKEVNDYYVMNNISVDIPFFPTPWLNGNTNFFQLDRLNNYFYLSYNFSFEIDYGNQYFYNDLFSIACRSYFPYLVNQGTFTNYNKNISFIDNFNNIFSQNVILSNDYATAMADVFTIYNKFNSENAYYTKFIMSDTFDSHFVSNISGNSDIYYSYLHYFIGRNDPNSNYNFYLISKNSKDLNTSFSPLIPNGFNDFYKSCEWWDIPSHLYNFLIYMVFDAPIISDFTRLAYVLIQFIVSVFEWIISLFTGFSNSFFIAIFVGFLVLMFLLKIIFKG